MGQEGKGLTVPKGVSEREDFTERDAAFITKYAEANFDVTKRQECAVAAGLGTGDLARMNGGRVTKALLQNKKLRAALKRVDVNMDTVAEKLKELLTAKSPLNPDANDNYIQHKTVETLIRVFDANPPQKIEVDKSTTQHIVITNEAATRLENYQKMRELTQDANTGVYTERP
jgi:S-adenosylmethionine:tRNA-ribosyltransferase-isomerase (queuine synthetase)